MQSRVPWIASQARNDQIGEDLSQLEAFALGASLIPKSFNSAFPT